MTQEAFSSLYLDDVCLQWPRLLKEREVIYNFFCPYYFFSTLQTDKIALIRNGPHLPEKTSYGLTAADSGLGLKRT